ISDRLATLMALIDDRGGAGRAQRFVVANALALAQRTFAPDHLRQRVRSLVQRQKVNPLALVEWLQSQGYAPETQVTQKGEIALRGGILDVFPLTAPWPVRLEFFGDELESLREFDPATQVSRGPIDRVVMPPGGELGLLRHAATASELHAADAGSDLDSPAGLGTLLDYLPPGTIVLLSEPGSIAEQIAQHRRQMPDGDPLWIEWTELLEEIEKRGLARIDLEEGWIDAGFHAGAEAAQGNTAGHFDITGLDVFRPRPGKAADAPVAEVQRREFFDQLHRWQRRGYELHVFCNNSGERERFEEIWREYGLPWGRSGQDSGRPAAEPETGGSGPEELRAAGGPPPRMHLGAISQGFLWETAGIVVVTDAEVFGRYRTRQPRRLKSPHAAALKSSLDIDFHDLEEGDYVVHMWHGIGRFLGLKNLPPRRQRGEALVEDEEGSPGQECLVIEYAPSKAGESAPRLYVPVAEAHLISKYIGATKARPVLHALGGTRWSHAKARAERSVRSLAGELLSLQAARAALPGHACGPDTPWQREFEASFLFEETRDQLQAIQEAKGDMEKPRPMDRLVCGDVGFGKTEVAIRAAFKAVMGGRQVAVLTPTTVLAQQHYNTFRERMADYPVRLELLSRFRSRREQQRAIEDLARGAVDIVIGTHRLLQRDVAFKDLGLVIIDEEQRFGVAQKERFKQWRQLVDVLTLSATPIPRTLYLALMGARDMSAIQTPPVDRLPVETIVIPFDEGVIRAAILRELNRQGQVFFLHNRVATIDAMALRLRQLVPEARIVVGHGQMDSDALEEVMLEFVNGRADLLLSTTIIESGLDIPNANTIIIDRADRFGLSDLYQLRGRVGRYKHQAYAYLLLPRHAGLLADARKRLSAIRQYSSLGCGFKIALRDLELRGAGNLLGSEQSGHITALGFDLYCQLLKESVAALRGEPAPRRLSVKVELEFLRFESPGQGSGPDAPEPGAASSPGTADPAATSGGRKRKARPGADPWEDRPAPSAHACLPSSYVPEIRHRIEFYRRLAEACGAGDVRSIARDLRDRFGPLPEPVELLLAVTDLKILCGRKGVGELGVQEDRVMIWREGELLKPGGQLPRLERKSPRARLRELQALVSSLRDGRVPERPPSGSGRSAM
ncbi:MAG: transcription-repair coupling factor, partial [Verrucomicrobia bacterium]|nr:transcription-repair coupling factor [Verrucomicrobiota bacterium]